MDAAPSTTTDVPPVAAVVVTCDPGWWLEDCLAALGAQDYPVLSVLVVDAGSAEDPTPRVAAVTPGAYVRRVRRRRGFGVAANEVLSVVEGASHFVFCHDDVAPDPSAVRMLVEEAFRSNAGIVAPKLVGWFAPDRLLAAGMGADAYGVPVPLVERGDLDQQQHDVVRDIFFAPSPCFLVRADLFTTLEGFDSGFGVIGEDLDLSWRAHLAGARAVVAPAARVRHLEATESGLRALDGGAPVGPDQPTAKDGSAGEAAGQVGSGGGLLGEVGAGGGSGGVGSGGAGGAAGEVASGGGPAGRVGSGGGPAGEVASGGGAGGVGSGGGAGQDRDPGAPPVEADGDPSGPAGARPNGLGAGGGEAGTPAPSEAAGEEPPWWDLARWDEEDESWGEAAAATAARHARRRLRRDAERDYPIDAWAGEDEGWAPSDAGGRRRRRRLAPLDPAPPVVHAGFDDAPSPVESPRAPQASALDARRAEARLRAVAIDYGPIRLVIRLTVLLLLTTVEATLQLMRHGPDEARRSMRPWAELGHQSRSIRKHRAAVRAIRTVPDRAIVAMQVSGVGRLRRALRTTVIGDPETGRPPAWDARRRQAVVIWVIAAAILVYGSRQLVVGHLPTIGELGPWPSVSTLTRHATSGWRATGLGTSAAAPTAVVLAALASVIALGHTILAQHILVLGLLPLGAVGAARLARPLRSIRARLVAALAYLVVPLPYNALANGRWTGLVAYAALPWVLGLLIRATGLPPFDGAPTADRLDPAARPPRPHLDPIRRAVATALLLALAGAVEPALLPLTVAIGLALVVGLALTGPWRAGARVGARALVLAASGAAGAAVLLFPWSVGWLPPVGEWAGFSGAAAAGHPAHVATLLRFQTGPLGAGVLGYAVLVVAAFPLLVGRGWRAAWATRLWVVALTSFGLAWAGQHGALGIGWPPAEVLLAPAAIAVALSAGLGIAAFEIDLPGYNFGWRQAASVVAAGAALLACVPVVVAAANGRWHQPVTGFDGALSWMAAKRADGDFRVLWLGSPQVLPIASWRLDATTAYATSVDGTPDVTDLWPGTSRGPTRLLGQAVTLAREGLTTDLGRLLAPMSVRYVVVVDQPSPLDSSATHVRPVPADITAGLESQLDLRAVDRSSALTVYENAVWAPIRVHLPDGAVAAAQLNDPRVARTVDLSTGTAVLPNASGLTSATGTLPAGADVELAASPSAHWQLRVGGVDATRQPAFGSANLFSSPAGGPATLRYDTPIGWRLALVVQALLWLGGLVVVVRGRSRRRDATGPDAVIGSPDDAPILVGAGR